MNVVPRFVFPWALLLLVLVPLSVWVGAKIRSLSQARKWTAIVLRSVILICLIAALAGAELVRENDKLAVFFLLDQSNSIPEGTRLAAAQSVRNTCDELMTYKDEAGVIVFGDESSIELSVGPSMELGRIQSYVSGEQTDLAGAIRLAIAAFPQGYMKRIVIYSDGNETRGSALEEAKLAQAAGIAVDVVPLIIGGTNEVRLREVSVPNRVDADEPFRLRVVAQAEQDCEATLRVFQRLKGGKRLLRAQEVTLQEGDNTFLLTQELQTPGFYEYEATIESAADTIPANNEGRSFTVIHGEPTVLYVEADPENSIYLEPALKAEGLTVVQATPGEIPTSLAQFQNFDAVVLSDVSSTDLSSDQLKSMEALVRDLGIGLVMIGGPDSFGAGGYLDTPVEKALPVSMDIKQRKVLPRGALVLIMHTCEIPNGNAWAREIGLASLNVLASQDLMGMLAYLWDQGGDTWVFPLQPVGNKVMMDNAIRAASSAIGDMQTVGPTLGMAYNALINVDAAVKRIVIISDGDPAAPTANLLGALAAAKISVSTVCIGPHSPSDQSMLQWIAQKTGGQYYFVTNPTNLPQIFTKEAAVVKRGILVEEPFEPKPLHDSELTAGVSENAFPTLRGYVVTTPKDSATIPLVSHEDDPVLAHWRYGLGKSVAFTSDVTNRWAADWIGWEEFNRFWAQTIRWAVREVAPTNFRVETNVRDGMGYVKIDAVDEEGRFVNFLRPKGTVTGPPPDFARYELDLMQTGPGIYESTFPLDERGIYMVNLTYVGEDGTQGMIPTGLALGYSREYEYNTSNVPLLEQIASVGGGAILAASDSPFEHNLETSATISPVWQLLVALAACLFPLEIFVRRVVVNFNAVYAGVAAALKKIPAIRRIVPMPAFKPAPVTGTYGAAVPARQYRYASRGREAPGSFGIQVAADARLAPEAIASPDETPEFPEAAQKEVRGHTEYTQRLLAAKRRAIEREKRRVGPKPDEEKQ